MIVPMKSVTLLTMAAESSSALEALRELGVMQIVQSAKSSSATQSAADACTQAEKVCRTLEAAAAGEPECEENSSATAARGHLILQETAGIISEISAAEQEISTLKQRLERLAVWGDFRKEDLQKLAAGGVDFRLCAGTVEEYKRAAGLKNISIAVINSTKSQVAFAAAVTGKFTGEELAALPLFKLADDDDPALLNRRKAAAAEKLSAAEKQFAVYSHELPAVRAACQELNEQLEFDRAADAMAAHGEVAVLKGFVPVPELERLRAGAKAGGWGLLITDPAEDENVPVLLQNNRFTRLIKPLFDFLGIVPGYRELDVSGGILVFFTIFYAIIIGDAGYGLCFTLLSLLGLLAAKKRPALKLPMRLFLILSVMTTVWGALCGSWFGLAAIPGTGGKPFPALEVFRNFSSETAKQANVQLFCFILAVAQLSCGRIWKALRDRNWRSIGDNIGWMLIIWGNFFLTMRLIVFPGEFPPVMYALYGVGLLLVMVCGVNWRNVADLFQFPFNIVGSFTDVLSYIRLFAVSLAGACIASSFNGMAFDVCKMSAWLLPAGALVVIFGHLLNIGLGFLSVLVHAVRLNTLEFSNHTGLSWSGQAFKPFKKTTEK